MNYLLSEEYYSTADSGLAGYWRFDEGIGQTTTDLSFFGNNATLGSSTDPDVNDPAWVKSTVIIVGLEEDEVQQQLPSSFALYQNYPNPFNPATSIQYELNSRQLVNLTVYNVLGKEVAALVNREQNPGTYSVTFDASGLSSGVYFYVLKAGSEFVQTRKMVLLK